MGERAARLHGAREPLADGRGRRRRLRPLPQRRRRGTRREAAAALGHPRCLRRGLRAGGHPGARGFQRRRQRGRRLFRGHATRRLALERRAGLPAPRGRTPEPERPHRRRGPAPRAAAAPRRRARLLRGGAVRRQGPGGPGGDPQRRRGQQPEAPAALRPRPRRPAPGARHPGRGRPARRRRQPPGPPADPQRLQGRRRADPERNLRAGWPARRGSRWNTRCTAPGR